MTCQRLGCAGHSRQVADAELRPRLRRLWLKGEQHLEACLVGEEAKQLDDLREPDVAGECRERGAHRLKVHHLDFAAVRGELPLDVLTRQCRALAGFQRPPLRGSAVGAPWRLLAWHLPGRLSTTNV